MQSRTDAPEMILIKNLLMVNQTVGISSVAACAVPISCWLRTALYGHLLSIVVAFASTLVVAVAARITLGNVVRVYPGTVQGLTFYPGEIYI